MFDLPALEALAANEQSRAIVLSGSTVALLLIALASAEKRHNWIGSSEIEPVSDSEWNGADGLVALAERELMSGLTGVIFEAVVQPVGSLACDGATYLRADYPALFEHWQGTSLIVDADTFRTPDLRWKFRIGADASHSILSSGGEETHVLTTDELPIHSHTYTAPIISDLDFEDVGIPQPATGINPIPQNTSGTGGGQAHNNMPPYTALGVFVWY